MSMACGQSFRIRHRFRLGTWRPTIPILYTIRQFRWLVQIQCLQRDRSVSFQPSISMEHRRRPFRERPRSAPPTSQQRRDDRCQNDPRPSFSFCSLVNTLLRYSFTMRPLLAFASSSIFPPISCISPVNSLFTACFRCVSSCAIVRQ